MVCLVERHEQVRDPVSGAVDDRLTPLGGTGARLPAGALGHVRTVRFGRPEAEGDDFGSSVSTSSIVISSRIPVVGPSASDIGTVWIDVDGAGT
ncbi:hypothetical protein [Halosolutus gelatinilyticus]|uniref:hypothetical protein n=1 Tax=Halosolutus gelatinilyticus TaxID=2931975 RepID=UPI001FF468A9|nr:hypothetical protein [Halosolutus gelatinilyticus]